MSAIPTMSFVGASGVARIDISPQIVESIRTDPFMLKMYLDDNGDPNMIFQGKPLIHGMSYECVKILRDRRIDIEVDARSTNDASTALHEACRSPRNNILIIYLIVYMKADPTLTDIHGFFPIDYAFRTSSNDITFACLEHPDIMDTQRYKMRQFVEMMCRSNYDLYDQYLDYLSPKFQASPLTALKDQLNMSPTPKWQFK